MMSPTTDPKQREVCMECASDKTIEEIKNKARTALNLFFMATQGDDCDYAQELERFSSRIAHDFKPSISQARREAVEETSKAYGGCTKCYGKGYSTQRHGLYVSPDFEGDVGYQVSPKTHMVFCKCDRGSQLEKLLSHKSGSKDDR